MNVYAVTAVAIYLLALLWVGLRGGAIARSSDMFNVFGRRAGIVRATAGYLSLIGGGELLTISQFGYDNGFGYLWFVGGIACGFVLLALIGDRVRVGARDIGANTFAGFVRTKFGIGAASGLGLVYLLALGSLLMIQFIVGGDLLAAVTGIPRDVTPLIMAGIIISYLLVAGYVAVLSTDVLRAVMLVVVLVVAALSIGAHGVHIVASTFSAMPVGDGLSLFVFGVFGVICAADVWQTGIASKDRSVFQRSMFGAAAAFLVVGSLIALLGAVTKQLVPQLPNGTSALVEAATHAVSPEFAPLIALMIIGAVMATADTEIWVIATTLLSVRIGSPREGQSEENFQGQAKKRTRWVVPMVAAAAVILGYLTRDAEGLYEGLLILLTAIAPAMLAVIFGLAGRVTVGVTVWAGIVSFVCLAVVYQLNIPLEQGFIPVGVGGGALIGGMLLERMNSRSHTRAS